MSTRLKFITIIVAVIFTALLLMILNDIRNTYIELGNVKSELKQIQVQFQHYQVLVKKVNEIDDKFTQEFSNVKAENDKLYNNVIHGIGRLQFNINKTASTSSVDASCTRLDDAAQRNYFLLRERIEQSKLQIEGLQKYINEVCLK